MGIFVNGRYFETNDYYNHEVVEERRKIEEDNRRRDQEVRRARAAAEKKRNAAKKKAKLEKEKAKAAGKDGVKDELVERLREAEGRIGSEFEFDPNQTYEQSVEDRYGDKFSSGATSGVSKLNSGLGAAPNQRVSSGRVAQDSSRRIGGPMKPTIGYQPPAVPGQPGAGGSPPAAPPAVQPKQTSFLSGGAFSGGAGIKTAQQGTPTFGNRLSGGGSKPTSGGGGSSKLPRPF
jgi:hypothetical protein